MEILSSLPKIVADVALAFMRQRNDNKIRDRLGDLLLKVSDCLLSIGKSIQAGVDPTDRCGELDVYIHHLEGLVSRECSDQTARQIVFWLTHVAEVPAIGRTNLTPILTREMKPRWLSWRREEQAREVVRIAGYIRAIGNMVKV